jgi:hypothetical protein
MFVNIHQGIGSRSITVNKNDEFFFAIVKQGVHSFLLLGVNNDNKQRVIARVGKTNDIDPDFRNTLKILHKNISKGSLARLADEGVSRRHSHQQSIYYQAYAINYEQMLEFLSLIKEIEEKQLANDRLNTAIEEALDNAYIDNPRIKAYVPSQETGDVVTLQHKRLESWEQPHTTIEHDDLAQDASKLKARNTCRTTTLNMVEAILGFKTHVSKYFFVKPRFKTKLLAGQPDPKTFYVLPLPPSCYQNLSKEQKITLKKLYHRLERIPVKHAKYRFIIKPDDELNDKEREQNERHLKFYRDSQNKFNIIKELYLEIAGINNLDANQLVQKIVKHETENHETLSEKRDPGFLSRFFSVKSSTQRLLQNLEKDLQHSESSTQSLP